MSIITRSEKGAPLTAADHDANITRLGGFANLTALLADSATYSFRKAGEILWAHEEGYRYEVAASGASDHHLTTAAGLKLYVRPDAEGIYNFMAFDPAADGSTDDYDKLMMALDLDPAPGHSIPHIHFPKNNYRMHTPVQINKPVHCTGIYEESIWSFPLETSGVTINNTNTRDGSAIALATAIGLGMTSGAGTVIDGIMITGHTIPSARSTHDGLWLRAPAYITNTTVRYFSRYGFRVTAWSEAEKPSNPELWGDASGWFLDHSRGLYCGESILHVRGDQASGGAFVLDATYGGRWGVDIHTEAGTSVRITGTHAATSGVAVAAGNPGSPAKSSMIHYGGQRYTAVLVMDANGDCTTEQLENFVDVTPGTDSDVWYPVQTAGEHSFYPTWVSGQTAGHYAPGGGYRFTGDGHMISAGCYGESDDPGTLYWADNMVDLGGIKERWAPPSEQWRVGSGGSLSGKRFSLASGDYEVVLGDDLNAGDMITAAVVGETDDWCIRWRDHDISFDQGTNQIFRVLGNQTDEQLGTGATATGSVPCFPMMALGNEGITDARRRTYLAAAPTTGTWAQGDVVFNLEPSPEGNAAWVCTSGGTPGTWKECLEIAA